MKLIYLANQYLTFGNLGLEIKRQFMQMVDIQDPLLESHVPPFFIPNGFYYAQIAHHKLIFAHNLTTQ